MKGLLELIFVYHYFDITKSISYSSVDCSLNKYDF